VNNNLEVTVCVGKGVYTNKALEASEEEEKEDPYLVLGWSIGASAAVVPSLARRSGQHIAVSFTIHACAARHAFLQHFGAIHGVEGPRRTWRWQGGTDLAIMPFRAHAADAIGVIVVRSRRVAARYAIEPFVSINTSNNREHVLDH
jgi:hypothetical protein